MSLCVLFLCRSLASGSTMLLLVREESPSCCFCTASLSSGRSEANQGQSNSKSFSKPDCKMLCCAVVFGICCIGHLSKISIMRIPPLLSSSVKSLRSGCGPAKTNPSQQRGVLIHRHDLPSGERGPKHSSSLPPDMK